MEGFNHSAGIHMCLYRDHAIACACHLGTTGSTELAGSSTSGNSLTHPVHVHSSYYSMHFSIKTATIGQSLVIHVIPRKSLVNFNLIARDYVIHEIS